MLTKKWRFNRCALLSLLVLFVAAGCGDEQVGGAGQCGGAASSGICVTVDLIAPGTISLPDSDDVDAFQNLDCGSGEPEEFSRHSAEVTLSVFNLIPSNEPGVTPGVPTFVTLTTYNIDYIGDDVGDDAVPTLTNRVFNETIRIDVDGSTTVTLAFVEIAQLNEFRKQEEERLADEALQERLADEILSLSYTAKYTFSGQDSLGNDVSVAASKTFQIGNFDRCS